MHARPAGELVNLVKSFAPAKVSISNGIKEVNAGSLLSILSLGLKCGTQIEIKVDCPAEIKPAADSEVQLNEEQIAQKIVEFIESVKD